MLMHIHVRNLAIIDEIEVELDDGMTALTGETGAGKSILVDALGLVLGNRADSSIIRHGAERAEITASFEIKAISAIQSWLAERELDMDGECQLRRIINREGRTRGYINGQPVPMQSLQELSEQLVDIHGQHEHQSLLHKAAQRQLLDAFGGHAGLLDEVGALHDAWRATQNELNAVIGNHAERDARLDLLRYQSNELSSLGLSTDDIQSIDEEHARQANAERLLAACQQSLQRLDAVEDAAACSLITRALEDISELANVDRTLDEPARLLNDASILVKESINALRHYADQLDIDPERLQWLEERIGILHDLARKHRCTPMELPAIEEQINKELDSIEHAGQHRENLEAKLQNLKAAYLKKAKHLSSKRKTAAKRFGQQITEAMQTLGMAGGVFEILIGQQQGAKTGRHGMDDIEFRVSANKGQPVQPLGKVASGGELSRISLSIQVISANRNSRGTLIFDEVDSGIGGGVAEIVGQKLRLLGQNRQVLCVTHLPQIAALANHQLQVTKLSGDDTTRTRIRKLDSDERIDEIARMLGGLKITQQTRDHAREMMLSGNGTKSSARQLKKHKVRS
jgi:DNA repair protein RecN (Recombination protein N)